MLVLEGTLPVQKAGLKGRGGGVTWEPPAKSGGSREQGGIEGRKGTYTL